MRTTLWENLQRTVPRDRSQTPSAARCATPPLTRQSAGRENRPGPGWGGRGVGGRRRGDLFGVGLFPMVAVLVAAPLCLSKLTELYTKMGGSHNV